MKKIKVPPWLFGLSIICYLITSFILYVVVSKTTVVTPPIMVVGTINIASLFTAMYALSKK